MKWKFWKRCPEKFNLTAAAVAFAHEGNCEECGGLMFLQQGLVVTWDEHGDVTARHLKCAFD
jgi:hypothetical protein